MMDFKPVINHTVLFLSSKLSHLFLLSSVLSTNLTTRRHGNAQPKRLDGCPLTLWPPCIMTELAKLSDDPNPAVTRVLFREHDMKARK
eukprot:scaffold207478_cov18-Prasinocladus_malaysianus.AAC.1